MRKRFLVMLLTVFLMVSQGWALANSTSQDAAASSDKETQLVQKVSAQDKNLFVQLPDYQTYLKAYKKEIFPQNPIIIEASKYSEATQHAAQVQMIKGQPVLVTEASGTVTWKFHVEEAGLYNLEVNYYNVEGNGGNIERSLYLDGKIPFDEMRDLMFFRTWENDGKKEYSSNGNEYRRTQKEVQCFSKILIHSGTGYVDDNYKFYLSSGEHSISFEAISDRMGISQLKFCQASETPSYDNWLANMKDKKIISGDLVQHIQGEDADLKSNATLYAIEDRTSPINEPYAIDRIQLNCIGGATWKYRGDWIQWTVNAPQEGLYRVAIRAKQSYSSGITATRTLSVNGEIPYLEAKNIGFHYSNDWQVISPRSKNGEMCYVYLKKGNNTLRLTNTLGELGEILHRIESSSQQLNQLYRQIRMIVGNTSDEHRDYHLENYIPNLKSIISSQSRRFEEYLEELNALSGQKGEATVSLDQICQMLRSFIKNPETIPRRIGTMRDNISSLSSWVLSASEQSLLVDYIALMGSDAESPQADVAWYRKLWNEIRSFSYSFYGDYSLIEQQKDEKCTSSVSLWLNNSVGRDQATIIKQMAENSFSPSRHVQLDLKLVDMTVLLRAVSAGEGPDVSIFMDQSTPVNYGIRSALYDLSRFSDCEEVLSRFSPSAVTPFRIHGKLYALPESQVYPMLFYRKDILSDMEIAVPDTWDELTQDAAKLQKKYMVVSLPTPASTNSGGTTTALNAIYAALLMQRNGKIYNDSGSTCLLNSKAGVSAFTQWSELYTKYKMPITTNALSYFRTGDAPLVISDYNFYNMLIVGAPEIKGLWGIAQVPGTMENGQLNRSCGTTVSSCLMYANAKDPKASWEFLKWWSSAEAQSQFGKEIEALQGSSGRWMSANLEARRKIPWDSETAATIDKQMKWVQGIPEVAGGYYVGRSIDNAVKSVINNGTNPQETLLDFVDDIQEEMTYKRKELGIK